MSRPIVAVDIDDVLAESAQAFVEYSNTKWGTNLTVEDYDEDWAKVWKVTHEEAKPRVEVYFHEAPVLTHKAYDAHVTLNALKQWYDLIVVTSRRTGLKGDTLEWIQREFPGVFLNDKIYFAGIWDNFTPNSIHQTKGELLKSLGATYHIDDQPKHCTSALEQGITPLLFGDYSWNRSVELPEGITRVKNWQEVMEYFNAERQRVS